MREFLIPLYTEHLEEASFLYDLCRSRRRDDEWPWTEVASTEERLEAHLDALVLGGELALEVGLGRMPDADAGEWFAVAVVCARRGLAQPMAALLRQVPLAKPLHLQALADALCQEVHPSWQASLMQSLRDGAAQAGGVHPVLLSLAWRRRWTGAAAVLDLARQLPAPAWAWCCTWLPAVTDPGAARMLPAGWAQVDVEDTPWASPHWPNVAQAQLALGRGAIDPLDAEWLTAWVGGAAQAQALLQRFLAEGPTAPAAAQRCVVLGLAGELGAVRPLLATLDDGGLAPHAAIGLYLITGAPLFEQVFVADEDEVQERPLQAGVGWPRPGDGRTHGVMTRQLSQRKAVWAAWLQEHAARFQAGMRHRLGRAWAPQVLLEALQSPDYPKALRPMLPLELWWRHGVDLPFDTDLRVPLQQALFRQAATSLAGLSAPPGQWGLGGQAMTLGMVPAPQVDA
jgi:hypothetical protein